MQNLPWGNAFDPGASAANDAKARLAKIILKQTPVNIKAY